MLCERVIHRRYLVRGFPAWTGKSGKKGQGPFRRVSVEARVHEFFCSLLWVGVHTVPGAG